MSTDLSMLAFATIFVFYLTIRSLLKVDVGVAKGTPEGCLYHSMLVLFHLNNIKPRDMISNPPGDHVSADTDGGDGADGGELLEEHRLGHLNISLALVIQVVESRLTSGARSPT